MKKGPCFNCKKEVTDGEYCFGCKTYVCDECDVSLGTYGHGHSPQEHLQEPEHEAW